MMTLRYRVEEGAEWWHVLDTHANKWSQTVDREPNEAEAVESCRRFNEGTAELQTEMVLSAEEWRAVVQLLRVAKEINRHAWPILPRRPLRSAMDALSPLLARMGWA